MDDFNDGVFAATPKVLIIDDVPANLKVLLAALSEEYDVMMATSGEQGLKLAAASMPDVILLDISMPGMDGHEVCRRLKSDPALKNIPVVFSTALSDPASEAKGLMLGAVDFINKPLRIEVVKLRLRNIIDGQRLRTLIENKNQALKLLSGLDPLTKLPNRNTLDEHLKVAVRQGKRSRLPLAVLFIDLDGFKQVNDQHGHAAGDQLLINLSQRLQDCLRDGDTVARIGGDEFVVIINNLEAETACLPMLDRMLDLLALPVKYGEKSMQVSASIGVRLVMTHIKADGGANVDTNLLIEQADEAMYAAKKSGKNRYSFFGQTPLEMIDNPMSSSEISAGLRAKEFELMYCPMADAQTGKIVAMEALLRWRHSELGLVGPGVFLLGFDKHPLSVEVGRWVLQQAIEQHAIWRAQGLHLDCNINISAYHLAQPGFAKDLAGSLSNNPGVSASSLMFDISEVDKPDPQSATFKNIEACRDMGVSMVLDDFGTGHSSLTFLRHLPISHVKLDVVLVKELERNAGTRPMIQKIVELLQVMNFKVIAEAVETESLKATLVKIGCDRLQGYAIGPVLAADDVPAFLNSRAKTGQ